MNRRAFIGSLVGGVATAAAVRTWPFRVYSFPTEIFSMEKLRRIYVDRALAEIDRAIRDYYPLPHVLCLPSFRLQDSIDFIAWPSRTACISPIYCSR